MGWVEIGRDHNVGWETKDLEAGLRYGSPISRTHDGRTVGIDFFVRKGACVMGDMSTCKGHHVGDGFLDSERGGDGQRRRTEPGRLKRGDRLQLRNLSWHSIRKMIRLTADV
jgi:hypothetical protein